MAKHKLVMDVTIRYIMLIEADNLKHATQVAIEQRGNNRIGPVQDRIDELFVNIIKTTVEESPLETPADYSTLPQDFHLTPPTEGLSAEELERFRGNEMMGHYFSLPYTIELTPDADGYWFASIPLLPGCMTQGASREEALRNIDEAKHLWLETALAEGKEIDEPFSAENPKPLKQTDDSDLITKVQ